MKKSIRVLQIVISSAFILSCSKNIKFDVNKWNDESDRGIYNYRNAMLDDLMENHRLKGKTIGELEKLFGFVDYDSTINQNKITFEVYQEWRGIDPSLTKYLVLRLNKSKIVDSIYTYEYKR